MFHFFGYSRCELERQRRTGRRDARRLDHPDHSSDWIAKRPGGASTGSATTVAPFCFARARASSQSSTVMYCSPERRFFEGRLQDVRSAYLDDDALSMQEKSGHLVRPLVLLPSAAPDHVVNRHHARKPLGQRRRLVDVRENPLHGRIDHNVLLTTGVRPSKSSQHHAPLSIRNSSEKGPDPFAGPRIRPWRFGPSPSGVRRGPAWLGEGMLWRPVNQGRVSPTSG